jgi:hypothetical protein
MAGPSATDEKLAERIDGLAGTLTDFRVEVAGKLAGIEVELRVIRNLGRWLLGGVFGLVAAILTGSFAVGWAASSMTSKAEQQGVRLDKLEGRLDGIERKLDTLIGRAAPKGG